MQLNDINDTTTEGKLLMAAMAIITAAHETNKTPDEVLAVVEKTAKLMYGELDVVIHGSPDKSKGTPVGLLSSET